MEEKLKEFEKDFNKANSTKEVGDGETYIQGYEEDWYCKKSTADEKAVLTSSKTFGPLLS
jgi:hypothetical protein